MLFFVLTAIPLVTPIWGAYLENRQATAASDSTPVPPYFQTTPEIYAGMRTNVKKMKVWHLTDTGPTATGQAPFLAQTNPAPFATSRSFVANAPLETALPITGDTSDASIFQLMGQLSPYFPNPR